MKYPNDFVEIMFYSIYFLLISNIFINIKSQSTLEQISFWKLFSNFFTIFFIKKFKKKFFEKIFTWICARENIKLFFLIFIFRKKVFFFWKKNSKNDIFFWSFLRKYSIACAVSRAKIIMINIIIHAPKLFTWL